MGYAAWLSVINGLYFTAAVKLAARFDNQLGNTNFTAYPTGTDDFQTFGVDTAFDLTADVNLFGGYFAGELPAHAYGDITGGDERAAHCAIEVKIVV